VVLQVCSTLAKVERCRQSPVLCEHQLLKGNAFRSSVAHFELRIGVSARVFRCVCERNVFPYRGKAWARLVEETINNDGCFIRRANPR